MLVQTTRSQIGMLVRFDLSCHLTLSLSTKPTSTHAPPSNKILPFTLPF